MIAKDETYFMDDNKSEGQTTRWAKGNYKETKRMVRRRDGLKCVACGEWGSEIAHIVPFNRTWKGGYNIKNIVTLCERCHLIFDNKNPDRWGMPNYKDTQDFLDERQRVIQSIMEYMVTVEHWKG